MLYYPQHSLKSLLREAIAADTLDSDPPVQQPPVHAALHRCRSVSSSILMRNSGLSPMLCSSSLIILWPL
jgi:hypothetical protein